MQMGSKEELETLTIFFFYFAACASVLFNVAIFLLFFFFFLERKGFLARREIPTKIPCKLSRGF